MKIAFITEAFPVRSETFILGKAAALAEAGNEVRVFAQFKRSDQVHPDLLARLGKASEAARLPTPDRARAKDIARALAAGGRLGQLPALYLRARKSGRYSSAPLVAAAKALPFAGARFDVVHAHYAHMAARYLEASELGGAPLVVSVLGHDLTYQGAEHAALYPEMFKQASRVLASSDYLAAVAVSMGAAPERTETLYPEVDTDFFKPVDRAGRAAKGGPLRLLSVGRLDWTKGYVYALHAARILADQGLEFTYRIVGEGALRPDLESAIGDLGLADRVTLAGAMDREQVRGELAQADLFLMPSVSESFGLAAAEAQAAGLPAIAADTGGLPEAVARDETGLFAPRRDPDALASRVLKLAADADLRHKMGEAAAARAKEKFGAKKIHARLLDIYKEVVAEARL